MSKVNNLHDFLQDIANAIKEKKGTTNKINAQKFAEEIQNLPSGGIIEEEKTRKDINFYDYDGTLLFSYTIEEANNLEALPIPNNHNGLRFQNWNWSLEDIKALNYPMDIGALYTTTDGKTRLYIDIVNEARMDVPLYIYQDTDNGVNINWGDGTSETISGVGAVSTVHKYENTGNYIITLEQQEDCLFSLYGDSSRSVMGSINTYEQAYLSMLYKVEFGEGVREIRSFTFNGCVNLTSVSITNDMYVSGFVFREGRNLKYFVFPTRNTTINSYTFHNATGIKGVSMPKTINVKNSAFEAAAGLKYITISEGITLFELNTLYGCASIKQFRIPNTVKEIGPSTFNACRSLSMLKMPSGLTKIQAGAFKDNYGIKKYDFSECLQVPSLDNINAFNNMSEDCKIVVPDNLLTEWKETSNWTDLSSHIISISDYDN